MAMTEGREAALRAGVREASKAAQLAVRESLAVWRGFPLFSGGPTADGRRWVESSSLQSPRCQMGRAA